MRARHGYGLITLAAVVVTLSGCTGTTPEANPPSSEPTTTTSESSSLNLPQRPKDLAIAGKQDADICTWLTSEQKKALDVGGGRPVIKDGNNYNGCDFAGELQGGRVQFGIVLRVVPEGIEDFVKKTADSSPETAANYDIQGFGAVQGQISGAESLGCHVFVDAAEGQTLYVDLALNSPGGMDNQQMCEKAKQAADAAVTTLQSQS
ncbi:hypothetical protein GCM10011581_08350 [Saccharopolyspora subtropica]|uniref:DUF3558 domain-containing protein n=1 Tax=Saccharopolyspora thermophila TaxID=89367 RepID=A0A917JML7_9PSEU|nr:DUF3558 family protein [Saccharopolyspora subtropica]GGI73696.1 hypothetical protein GCM10011581_08350 [Saccharopolyspora subtropica]